MVTRTYGHAPPWGPTVGPYLGAYDLPRGGVSILHGPVDPSFRALSGRLKFSLRRHKFNEDPLFSF
jgi:hypothetical protein